MPYDPDSSADAEALFPEYLTCEDKSRQLARHVVGWLSDRQQRERLIERLAKLKAEVGHGGAAQAAAKYILAELRRRPTHHPLPHFIPGRQSLARPAPGVQRSAA